VVRLLDLIHGSKGRCHPEHLAIEPGRTQLSER